MSFISAQLYLCDILSGLPQIIWIMDDDSYPVLKFPLALHSIIYAQPLISTLSFYDHNKKWNAR